MKIWSCMEKLPRSNVRIYNLKYLRVRSDQLMHWLHQCCGYNSCILFYFCHILGSRVFSLSQHLVPFPNLVYISRLSGSGSMSFARQAINQTINTRQICASGRILWEACAAHTWQYQDLEIVLPRAPRVLRKTRELGRRGREGETVPRLLESGRRER